MTLITFIVVKNNIDFELKNSSETYKYKQYLPTFFLQNQILI